MEIQTRLGFTTCCWIILSGDDEESLGDILSKVDTCLSNGYVIFEYLVIYPVHSNIYRCHHTKFSSAGWTVLTYHMESQKLKYFCIGSGKGALTQIIRQ
jgi:hypothetical protein